MPTSIDVLYRLAELRGGYFTTAQARDVDVSRQQLSYLARTESIDRVAHGIYRLRRFPAQRFEDVIVACLWAGEDAAASHDTALAVYELTDAMPSRVHVTVPRPFRGRRRGVVVHVAPLDEVERTVRAGVPITTVERTVADIADQSGTAAAVEAATQALERGLVTRRRLRDALAGGDERTEAVLEALADGRGVNADGRRYATAAALRAAVEDRLRRRAQETGVPLDRLRKELAHQRLLARLDAVAPDGSWVLKGGQALLARLDEAARATKDADATWRASLDAFRTVIDEVAETDLGDGFEFEIAAPRPLVAETDEGGLRYLVLALLDGREFERLQFDVNIVAGDARPTERLRLRDLLGIVNIEPPEVSVVPPGQHMAEKLHAYTRQYASGASSRPRDLFDMLAIARSIPLPTCGELVATCRDTFARRDTTWPPPLVPPPANWAPQWSAYVREHELPWRSLDEAAAALAGFWHPLLAQAVPASSRWNPERWTWQQR